MNKSCDVLIIGAGVVGLAVARELSLRGVKRITLLEKEDHLGAHASGRNSGVLHAGIYYWSDSLKARFCSRGAKLMKEFARQNDVEIFPAGKVLVATEANQLPELEKLYKRSVDNAIRVEKITQDRLRDIEPTARTVGWALYSPDTAVMNPKLILEALRKQLEAGGSDVQFSEPAVTIDWENGSVSTSQDSWSYGHLVNAAGLHADRFAHQMGVGLHYRILPFRGRYKKLNRAASEQIRGLIYPIPDPRLPFLGVHVTKSMTGDAWVGPTAEPALGRDHYGRLSEINWKEFPALLMNLLVMTATNANGLAAHIREEVKKQLPGGLLAAAQELVPFLRRSDFSEETKTGLRAQLVDTRTQRLVMDFIVEKGPRSTHVLNAVSPGFTASFAFAEYIADLVLK